MGEKMWYLSLSHYILLLYLPLPGVYFHSPPPFYSDVICILKYERQQHIYLFEHGLLAKYDDLYSLSFSENGTISVFSVTE